MQSRALAIVMVAACGGTYGGQPPEHPKAEAAAKPHRGIEDAALPYTVLDAKTGHQVETNAFWAKLATERAVCVGEEHKNPHHHWVELEVMRHMIKQWPASSPRALGMEMFQRPFQGVLDDYAAKRIDEEALRSRAGWEDRWGYDYGFYRPTIAVAVDNHASLLALNAAKELTKKVAHHGLASLTPEERAQLPTDLDLNDKKHRAWFDALMEDMSGGSDPHNPHGAGAGSGSGAGSGAATDMPSEDAIYTVQVIWDETMADTAATWLKAHPDGHVIILAGGGHCHDSAIVNRIKRRGIPEVVSIRPVIDDKEGSVADALAKPINDYFVVLEMPPGVERAPASE
jgi:uncharacterized iron-regulated protein